ncbi:hypothetical protein FIM02_00525 [SAR202 cluster bacterium AD-802-E10_MRT_200m]|nr:hypothetical protein [SAR202 cluster bacterium AD-802-E10_MRT_200m]
MDWLWLALISAFLFAVVVVLDKRLLVVYIPNVKTFYFLAGFQQLCMAAIVLLIIPWSSSPTYFSFAMAISSGIVWALGLIFMFYGISRLDVSRVIPIAHTFPVFVTIMAVWFLNETILPIQVVAIIVTVIGAGLVAKDPTRIGDGKGSLDVYVVVLLGSVLTALANVTYKYALETIEFWNLLTIRSFCLGLVLLAAGYNSRIIPQIKFLFWNRNGTLLFIATEVITAPLAIVAMVLALALGPVSLVSTVLSIRPLFVLIISGLLSTRMFRYLNEPLTRETLPLKLLSTGMIVGGVTVLTLT